MMPLPRCGALINELARRVHFRKALEPPGRGEQDRAELFIVNGFEEFADMSRLQPVVG